MSECVLFLYTGTVADFRSRKKYICTGLKEKEKQRFLESYTRGNAHRNTEHATAKIVLLIPSTVAIYKTNNTQNGAATHQ